MEKIKSYENITLQVSKRVGRSRSGGLDVSMELTGAAGVRPSGSPPPM